MHAYVCACFISSPCSFAYIYSIQNSFIPHIYCYIAYQRTSSAWLLCLQSTVYSSIRLFHNIIMCFCRAFVSFFRCLIRSLLLYNARCLFLYFFIFIFLIFIVSVLCSLEIIIGWCKTVYIFQIGFLLSKRCVEQLSSFYALTLMGL